MAFYVVTYPSFDVVEEHDEYSQAQRRAAKLSTRMRQVWAVDENQLYGARKRCEAVRQSEVAQAQPAPAPKRRRGDEPAWLAKARPLLGTMPDGELASLVGTSKASVVRWRKRLGASAFYRDPEPPDWLEQA